VAGAALALYGASQQQRSTRLDAARARGPRPSGASLARCRTRAALRFAARARAAARASRRPVGADRGARDRAPTWSSQGTDRGDLRNGPGPLPDTPLPGARGTVAIAGHRTTYGAPFRHLDGLEPATGSTLTMPYGASPTASSGPASSRPTRRGSRDRVAYDRLVLTACHPLYSARQRIVVFARSERGGPRSGDDPIGRADCADAAHDGE
jgi:sortase A